MMMLWVLAIAAAAFFLLGVRSVPESERAVIDRFGQKRVAGPGIVMTLPFLEKVVRVPVQPFSVSLPPQSVITKDEVPIQLQASLAAHVLEPAAAAGVRDWRIAIVSELQAVLKERIEELDFDAMDSIFRDWVASIRRIIAEKAAAYGVEVTDLQISNLSPRTRP
jgi:regulator of protease activity HflC (stomatin/prohibitin superfamily)